MTLDLMPIVGKEQLAVLERLVSEDQAGMAEFGGFYGQASSRLAPLLGPDRRAWLVLCDGSAVGFIDGENVAGRVELSYFVAAAFRGRGIARQAVERLIAAEVWPGVVSYAATVADGNLSSAGVARAAGFREVGRNDYGETVWELRPRDGADPTEASTAP